MEQVLYKLPDGWEWQQLIDVVDKTENLNPLKDAEQLWTYIDISSVDRERFAVTDPKEILGKDAPSRAKKHVQLNDVIFATTRPNLKNIALIREEYSSPVASTGFCVLRANKKVLPAYLFYFVTTDFVQAQIEPYVGGASYPAITDGNLKKAPIPIPSIEEQKRIVEKLDALLTRIDAALEHLQESVTLADALYASLLDQAFNPKSPSSNEDGTNQLPNGWRKVPLGTIVELSQGTQIPVGDQFVEQDEGFIRFLRISDFVRYDEPPRYILYPGPQYIVQEDDVCMIRYGDAGRAVTGLAGALANNLFKISPNEMLSKRFLFLQLQSPRCVEYLRASNNSSTMPAISFKAVNAMEFNLPPLDEQQQIIEKLNNANKLYLALKGLFENKIRYFNALKASILDSAFKGEL